MFGIKTIQKIRVIARFNKTLLILFRAGFNHLIYEAGLVKHIPFLHRILHGRKRIKSSELPKKLREALIKLGPVYIKFGQILSTRWDILPREYTDEFEKLQATVPPFSYLEAKQTVEESFGRPLHKIFHEFSRKPFASASLGQVYKAKLPSGEIVAVKVQRPKAKDQIQLDTEVLLMLAHFAEKYIPAAKDYSPLEIVQEFRRWTLNEIDYRKEAANCEVFSTFFKNDAHIYGPKVFWDYSTDSVLTLEYIEGESLSKIMSGMTSEKVDKKLVAHRIGESFIRQYFEYGYFHADPHPGNLFVVKNNNLVFLDFGMVGYLDQRLTSLASGMFLALIQRDAENLVTLALQIEESYDERAENEDVQQIVKVNALRKELNELLLQWPSSDEAGRFTRLFFDVVNAAIKNGFAVPVDLIMLSKSVMTLDIVMKELDPSINLEQWEGAMVQKILKEKFKTKRVKSQIQNTGIILDDLLKTLPESTARIINNLEKAKFGKGTELKDLLEYEQLLNAHHRMHNYAILIAALIIGSTLIYQVRDQPKIMGLTLSHVGLYTGLILLVLFLITNFLRKGK